MKNTNTATATQTQNEIIFLMGTPAAGKSTIGKQHFGATHEFIDCDLFKASHPDYDPKNPALLHDWSSQMADAQFDAALWSGRGLFVKDGTGANAEHLVHDIKRAQAAGFVARVFYVKCTLETSLRRNARRERVVPEHIVIDKATTIADSFEIVSMYADSIEVFDNDEER
jgi:predicted kinase